MTSYNWILIINHVDYSLNALLNRCVLSLFLNCSTLGLLLTSSGRSFHCLGLATEKLLSANVFLFVLGTINLLYMLLDLSPCLWHGCSTSKFCRYCGASPTRHLYTNVSNLCWILYLIGSQCSSFKHILILSLWVFPVMTLAAAFWTHWSFLISLSGKP